MHYDWVCKHGPDGGGWQLEKCGWKNEDGKMMAKREWKIVNDNICR